jgi:DNA-binding NarL/FixJ family response regulator
VSDGDVLLVDDDRSLLSAAAGVLRHHGFDVECHEEAASAVGALDRRRFDLVLTDLHLPGATGLELLRQVHARGLDTSVIVITGEPTVASAIEAIRLAALDYVLKPFDPEDLAARVRRGVEKSRARRRVTEAQHRARDVLETLEAIQAVLDLPGCSAPRRPTMQGLTAEERSSLSQRELEVLQRLVEGESPKEVAAALFLSQHTVRNHLRSIYAKLGVHSQLELLRKVVG